MVIDVEDNQFSFLVLQIFLVNVTQNCHWLRDLRMNICEEISPDELNVFLRIEFYIRDTQFITYSTLWAQSFISIKECLRKILCIWACLTLIKNRRNNFTWRIFRLKRFFWLRQKSVGTLCTRKVYARFSYYV